MRRGLIIWQIEINLEHIHVKITNKLSRNTKIMCISRYCYVSLHNVILQDDGSTCLMSASWNGHVDTVRVLLEAKADPNITDEVKLHYSHCY